MTPNLSHYPSWLRELIFPTDYSDSGGRSDLMENEKALRKIYEGMRNDPVYRVLFIMTIECIRMRFRVYSIETEMKTRCFALSERINTLENELKKLEKRSKK